MYVCHVDLDTQVYVRVCVFVCVCVAVFGCVWLCMHVPYSEQRKSLGAQCV